MIGLQHPYISAALSGGTSYGGGQQHSPNAMLRRCGCGVVAAADLLLYLTRWHPFGAVDYFAAMLQDSPIPMSVYNSCIQNLSRTYFPMIPYGGINGLMLMTGMQLFFRRHGMPYSARWCVLQETLWERIEAMLLDDIPVIMCVGPNFPVIWGDRRVRFFVQRSDGSYAPVNAVKAHFFTVTGIDRECLRISSWGRLYYLNRQEFEDYVRRYSTSFASNILLVEQKRG